jgi:predicted nuclease of predicted toxin-antitoxin system
MKFVIDMNLSLRWVEFLADAGHEAVHWSQIGAPDDPDEKIVDYAVEQSCVVLTHDLDFGIMLALGGLCTPSVVQFRAQAVLPGDIGGQLLQAIEYAGSYLDAGALVTVEPGKHRATVLPVRRET